MKFEVRDTGDEPGVTDLAVDASRGAAITPATVDTFLTIIQNVGLSRSLATAALSTATAYYAYSQSDRVFLRDLLDGIVSTVRRRRLVEELPRQVVPVPWMESHAPRGGTVAVLYETTEKRSKGLKLSVAGVGGGTKRSVEVTHTQDDAPFDGCTTYYLNFSAIPRRYTEGGDWQLENLRYVGKKSNQTKFCPFCSIDPDSLDPNAYALAPHKDYTRRLAKLGESDRYRWTKDSHIDMTIPINVHGVPVDVGIELSRSSSVTWKVAWEFAPGYFYQPYRPVASPDLPPMWASSGSSSNTPT